MQSFMYISNIFSPKKAEEKEGYATNLKKQLDQQSNDIKKTVFINTNNKIFLHSGKKQNRPCRLFWL